MFTWINPADDKDFDYGASIFESVLKDACIYMIAVLDAPGYLVVDDFFRFYFTSIQEQ